MALDEVGIPTENIEKFLKIASEDAFVLEDIADELGISESEARMILIYLMASDKLKLKQVWVPIKL